jgi:rubredoxin
MNREQLWIEHQRFRGWGCSECAWVFSPSGPPANKPFEEMMRNFESQRDKEFTLHVCADHPKANEHKEPQR